MGYIKENAFFKLLHISKIFSSIFIEENLNVSGAMQFNPVLFKGHLYTVVCVQGLGRGLRSEATSSASPSIRL